MSSLSAEIDVSSEGRPSLKAQRGDVFGDLRGDLAYLKPEEAALVEEAFRVADAAHDGQTRTSGEPYITHPVAVARVLAAWHLDAQAIAAALLHDVAEDTRITVEEIRTRFGKSVADLVDGVSKLDRLEFASREAHVAASFRKMLLAMARDVRVILIKLADRLHNMRTLGPVAPEKAERVARETLELHAPIAYRLGLSELYYELEDLALRTLHPTRFAVLERALKKARGNRREVISTVVSAVEGKLAEFRVEAQISGREKHISSIYKKMKGEHLAFSGVLDIYGFRIVCADVAACYTALGAVHTLYRPIPGKFQDHIAIPKGNGYQSLHTKVYGPFGMVIEFQIRTSAMHRVAETGIAAHWLYKLKDDSLADIQARTHQWLQSILELQTGSDDPIQFLEHVKVDLFPHEVYVFSPKGQVFRLPRGATVLDFAYAVHTDVGNHAVAAQINGEAAMISTVLRNGDRVAVLTEDLAFPSPDWLAFVTTAKARTRIRHQLKVMQQADSSDLGGLMLGQAIRALGFDPAEVCEEDWRQYMKGESVKDPSDVLSDIGLGKRLAVVVARKLLGRHKQLSLETDRRANSLTIRGSEGLAVQFAPCCKPIPGDPIIGQIRHGQGLFVHTHDCLQVRPAHRDPEHWIDVNWDAAAQRSERLFDVDVRLTAANQRGVLAKLAAIIAEAQANIEHFEVEDKPTHAYTTIVLTLQVRDRAHLAGVLRELRRIPEVVRLARVRPSSSSGPRGKS
jgi:GTP pyrophosphokinase